MKNSKEMNLKNRNGGRHHNSKNKFSKASKQKIFSHYEKEFIRINKHFAYLSHDEKFKGLKPIIKALCTGNDEISIKTKQLIYESLETEFIKLKLYFYHLPRDKKAIELRQFLKFLDKNQIEEIFSNIK